MNTNEDGTPLRVTVGRGHDTHDQHPAMAHRTRCGLVWTDECAHDAALTCNVCKRIAEVAAARAALAAALPANDDAL